MCILPSTYLVCTLPITYRTKCLFLFSDEPAEDRDAKYFKFKMPALTAHLKKLAEQGQAPYYNIDILKYQVNMHVWSITSWDGFISIGI